MPCVSRRRFLASFVASISAPTALRPIRRAPRTLRLDHLHTGERLTVDYFLDGAYDPEALATVNRFLRDFRTNEVHAIDASLLDLLHRISDATNTGRPFQVISGFRSPKTNARLRQKSHAVAARSLHMVGQAIDIRLADVPLTQLRAAALSINRGGVGFYQVSNFVHVDVGPVRHW